MVKPAARGRRPIGSPEVAKILASGLRLLDQVSELNPNSKRYTLKAEMCEAELRDVLRLDPGNAAATIALGQLFLEFYSEGASEEAIDLLQASLKHHPKNRSLAALIKKHTAQLAELRS